VQASAAAQRTPRAWWRAIPRRRRVTIVVVCAALFLAVGVVLARFLSAENVEREEILAVLQAQAHGDPAAELALLAECAPASACATAVRASAASLKRPGAVKIVSLKSSTSSSLGSSTGTTRVAWTVIGRLPVVQCVRVHRSGNVLNGVSVQLLTLSGPIGNEADC
jgi:hypothetical protein